MSRRRYVDMEVEVTEEEVQQMIDSGFAVKRGNQHGTYLYLTKKGSRYLNDYCKSIIDQAANLKAGHDLQDEWFDEHGVPKSERNYRG